MSVKNYCVLCGDEDEEFPLTLEGSSELGLYNYDRKEVPAVCENCSSSLDDDAYADARIFYVGRDKQMALIYHGKDDVALAIPQHHWSGFNGYRDDLEIDSIVSDYARDMLQKNWERRSEFDDVSLDAVKISSLDIDEEYIVVFSNTTKVYSK